MASGWASGSSTWPRGKTCGRLLEGRRRRLRDFRRRQSAVEKFLRLYSLAKLAARFKPNPVSPRQFLQRFYDIRDASIVGITQWAAAVRRPAGAQDHCQVDHVGTFAET